MIRLLAPLAFATILGTAASASARGFDSTLTTEVEGPVKVEIVLSESLAWRGENLPKELSLRSGGARMNSSFGNNGRYGDKELTELVASLEERLVERFEKKGVELSETAPTLLRITVEDARPNRPTFNQLRTEPSLSMRSIGRGGIDITADVIGAGGVSLGTMEYSWYDSDIRDGYSPSTWSDAKRGFSRFATRAAKELN